MLASLIEDSHFPFTSEPLKVSWEPCCYATDLGKPRKMSIFDKFMDNLEKSGKNFILISIAHFLN